MSGMHPSGPQVMHINTWEEVHWVSNTYIRSNGRAINMVCDGYSQKRKRSR